jgi:trehalose-6-phosphate synthase
MPKEDARVMTSETAAQRSRRFERRVRLTGSALRAPSEGLLRPLSERPPAPHPVFVASPTGVAARAVRHTSGWSTPAPVLGSQLVIVANRLPVRSGPAGEWKPSPGGLVSALLPVARHVNGTWVGWPGAADTVLGTFRHDGVELRPVPLSSLELDRFYGGFSNATLWPLLHDAIRPPRFDPAWWASYARVNDRYARHVASAAAPGARVWVHDYHLMLVPSILRRQRPDLRVGFFLHTPFPAPALLDRTPCAPRVLEGLAGADLIGVQTDDDARNLREAFA